MSSQSIESEVERRKQSKKVYESVMRTVDYQSGGMQPPLASKPSVLGILSGERYGLERLHRAIVAARRNGDIFQATDSEGRVWIGINDAEILVGKIEHYSRYAERHRSDLIGIANKQVQKLREVDDE